MSEPTRPLEAELIESLRTAVRPKMSIRSAAKQAGLSDSRWHQIIKGYRQEAGGIRVPVRAPADTLARMARVVGATPDQLRGAGRSDAAVELEAMARKPGGMTPSEFVQAGRRGARLSAAGNSRTIEQVENRFWALGKQIDAAGRYLAAGDIGEALSTLISAGSLLSSITADLDVAVNTASRLLDEEESPHATQPASTSAAPATQQGASSKAPQGEKNGAADRRRLSKAPDLPSDDQAADVEPPAYPPSGLAVAANEGGPKGIETPPGEDEYSQDPDDHQE